MNSNRERFGKVNQRRAAVTASAALALLLVGGEVGETPVVAIVGHPVADPLLSVRDRSPDGLAQLPQDEQATDIYETIRQADTVGMFQIESRAQMASLPRNRPARFYDLVVQVGLIRPGPIVGKMTNPYLRRRQGKEQVTYPHPTLEPVLKRTLGVPLFQEQLLKMAMICANFSGGEAEELRRALGSKRSEHKMKKIEAKLRSGMTQNKIDPLTQDAIVQFITAFALYGFPESHAASFALLAFASAFLKVRYLAAFTAALLNNQPMGFYAPSTIVKDAQRHGLKVRPVDVMKSAWLCTLENAGANSFALRMGLRYVRGMREQTAKALVCERELKPFSCMDELAQRVPELCRNELARLAEVGALNGLAANSRPLGTRRLHRRDALWHVERLSRPAGPLFESSSTSDFESPLAIMTSEERLLADFDGTGLTVGPHPMQYRRKEMDEMCVIPASGLHHVPNGKFVRIAGCVIVRQRPSTASGFIFLSLEDETGISNAIITPDLYDQNRLLIIHERFLLIEGILQNQDNVSSVKAARVLPLNITQAQTQSHDFH